MKTTKLVLLSSQGFILLSALSLLSVSLMAFLHPQSVMDLVAVQLNNNDAISSIRGVYGGVGFALFLSLIYLMRHDPKKGLVFLCLLWGFYALSRFTTMMAEGALGAFGKQWFITESLLCLLAFGLVLANRKWAIPQLAKSHEAGQ